MNHHHSGLLIKPDTPESSPLNAEPTTAPIATQKEAQMPPPGAGGVFIIIVGLLIRLAAAARFVPNVAKSVLNPSKRLVVVM